MIAHPQQTPGPTAGEPIGRIVSVTGSQAIVLLNREDPSADQRAELGTVMNIHTPTSILLGLVSALSIPVPSQEEGVPEVRIAELELVGELTKSEDGVGAFRRGVSNYPSIGDSVHQARAEELRGAYLCSSDSAVRIGTLRQDASIPAMVQVDELLSKHFAILGSTGTGKSCGVALILRSILDANPNAHVLLLDPHNEYASSFGDNAEVITPTDLQLPFWLLTFEELLEVIVGDARANELQVEILADLVPAAKARYAANRGRDGLVLKKGLNQTITFTVDTPVPYRMSDLIDMIDIQMGRLENRRLLSHYRQLRSRIEAISQDPRYAFMFGGLTVQDRMTEIISRLFRVPVNGKPIAILELTGVPPEIVNVVVSLICRMTFDFALWGSGDVPITLVCEEAHRYVPSDPKAGFKPTKRAISRIAKEGRKYGVSLCVVTQRPSELDPTMLSQCNTIFSMRMSNERDQAILRAAIFDTAAGFLDFLPSMGTREAIVFGDGVPLPGRIKFDDLPEHAMPRSRNPRFTEKWKAVDRGESYLEEVVERWRAAESPETIVPSSEALDGAPDAALNNGAPRAPNGPDPAAADPHPQHTAPDPAAPPVR